MTLKQVFHVAGFNVTCESQSLDNLGDIPTKVVVGQELNNQTNALADCIKNLVLEKYRGDGMSILAMK